MTGDRFSHVDSSMQESELLLKITETVSPMCSCPLRSSTRLVRYSNSVYVYMCVYTIISVQTKIFILLKCLSLNTMRILDAVEYLNWLLFLYVAIAIRAKV